MGRWANVRVGRDKGAILSGLQKAPQEGGPSGKCSRKGCGKAKWSGKPWYLGKCCSSRTFAGIKTGSRVQSMAREEVGFQHQVFCDPAKPLSARNIQPAPWAEFALGAEGAPELSMLLTQLQRVSVTIPGGLVGPELLGPADPTLPLVGAFQEWAPSYHSRTHVDSLPRDAYNLAAFPPCGGKQKGEKSPKKAT